MRSGTGMRISLSFVLVATLLVVGASARPANDWSKPCFNGECAYDLPEHSNSGLGALKIAGSPKSITDITSAAGWVVLDCDPHALEQEIRLVCQSDDDADDTACNHVFDHWGPEDKIVRLPESCGAGPFARIAAASLASNQDLPAHAEGKVVRRSGIPPVIHSFKIDTNFDLVDVDKVGPINFAFVGLTAPSPSEAFTHPDIDLNFAFVDGWFDDVFKSVGSWNATHFEFEPTVELAPVKFDGSANLIDYKPTGCPGGGGATTGGVIAGELKVDVAGTGGGNVKAGVIVDGSIVPPKIRDFAAFAGLSFDVDASVTIKAAVFGGYDSGRKPIIKSLGLPGFSIPGVLTIGPMVELQAQAKAFLDLKIDSVVHLAYKVDDLELWYPESKKKSTEKGIHTKPSPLKLKAKAKASAKGYIEGHLVPILKLGVEALGGKAGADVYLEADAFARVSVQAEAHATATAKVGAAPAPAAPAHPKKGKREVAYVPPYSHRARNELAPLSKRTGDVDVHAAAKGGFSGCVWLDAGLQLNYGAKANAGDLWKVDEHGTLWTSPIWPIWSGCFAAGTKSPGKVTAKSSWDPKTLDAKFAEKKLTCDADAGDLEEMPMESLASQTLQN
ncbi:hypothetical protein EYR38_003100 [Pleurotus pulmonarius]|nr:hypothetical protein EYR38_003100 [Pleurotus pulmonarius]